jgi:hypothetical protein
MALDLGAPDIAQFNAAPIAEYLRPQVPVEAGNALFWYIFDGEPVAADGHTELSDTQPALGLALKTPDANVNQIR